MLAQSLLFSSQVMHGLRGVTPPGKLYQNDAALGNTRGNAEILSFSFFFWRRRPEIYLRKQEIVK